MNVNLESSANKREYINNFYVNHKERLKNHNNIIFILVSI